MVNIKTIPDRILPRLNILPFPLCSIISSSNISRPGSPHKLTSIITSLLSQRHKQHQILPSPVNSNAAILWNRQNFDNEDAKVKDVASNDELEETKDQGMQIEL